MELITNTTQPEPADIEQLLAEVGMDFTVVDHCPDSTCDVCAHRKVSAAA